MDAALFDSILLDIAAGEAAYKVLLAHNVPRKAFYAYLAANAEAGNRYARAKYDGLERLADEILELADEERRMLVVKTFKNGDSEEREIDVVERSRLQVDSRKWLLSKLVPKRYGERKILAGDEDAPIEHKFRWNV